MVNLGSMLVSQMVSQASQEWKIKAKLFLQYQLFLIWFWNILCGSRLPQNLLLLRGSRLVC